MSYTVESINGCTKKLVFSFETLDLSSEIKTALQEKQKTVNLKGFRKGKVPLSMVEKLYRPQVESEALNKFVQNKLFEAIDEEKLKVVGYPRFENMNYDPGKSVSFDVICEVWPDLEIKDPKKATFTKKKAEVSEDDIDALIKNYLSSKAEVKDLDDSKVAENGHVAVINFEGEKEDGERPENMKGSDHQLELGSNSFIPGFEEGVVGMKKGDKKVIDLTFPENYQVDELKNAKVKFHVELVGLKVKEFPEFTDELAKEFGSESVEDFKSKNKENMLKQKEVECKQELQKQILDKYIEINSFDVPESMIKEQKDHIKEDVSKRLTAQGFTEKMLEEYFEKWTEDLDSKALFQVKTGLVLDHLAKKHQVEADDSDLEEKFEESAKMSGASIDEIKNFYNQNKQAKTNLLYAVREEKTFDKVIEGLNVVEA